MSLNSDYSAEELEELIIAAIKCIIRESTKKYSTLEEIIDSYAKMMNAMLCLFTMFDADLIASFDPILTLKKATSTINISEITGTPLEGVLIPGTEKFDEFMAAHPEIMESDIGNAIRGLLNKVSGTSKESKKASIFGDISFNSDSVKTDKIITIKV